MIRGWREKGVEKKESRKAGETETEGPRGDSGQQEEAEEEEMEDKEAKKVDEGTRGRSRRKFERRRRSENIFSESDMHRGLVHVGDLRRWLCSCRRLGRAGRGICWAGQKGRRLCWVFMFHGRGCRFMVMVFCIRINVIWHRSVRGFGGDDLRVSSHLPRHMLFSRPFFFCSSLGHRPMPYLCFCHHFFLEKTDLRARICGSVLCRLFCHLIESLRRGLMLLLHRCICKRFSC